MLDRAEGLLSEIVKRRDAQYKQGLSLLMDLYEQEREWQKAIQVSKGFAGGDSKLHGLDINLHNVVTYIERAPSESHVALSDL